MRLEKIWRAGWLALFLAVAFVAAPVAVTPAVAQSNANVVGVWTGEVVYPAGGSRTDTWTFRANGSISYELGDGTWSLSGATLTWTSTGGYRYTGRISNGVYTGTRYEPAGNANGTFTMRRSAAAAAPAPAPTPSAAATGIVGRWTGQITYAAGGGRQDTWTFESGGVIRYDLGDGTWTERNGLISWTSTGGYVYEGRIQGNQIIGTRRDPDGSTTGTFVMTRSAAAPAPASGIVGRWSGQITYAAGGGRTDTWTFEAGGVIHYDLGDGNWTERNGMISWTSTGGYVYEGRLQGDQIIGTRRDPDGSTTGTFVMNRQR